MKKTLSIFICMIMIFSLSVQTLAADNGTVNTIVSDIAEYLCEAVPNPQIGSIGGEWCVLGLARSGADIPDEYFENYYQTVEKYVKDCGGVLHDKKYTEYSRLIITITAIDKNPADVAGFNLLTPLGDYEKTIWQGINGPVWALLALDSGNYDMPHNSGAVVQATREMYVDRILECQLPDGGWSLLGSNGSAEGDDMASDPDITGMVLQALAKYQDDERVKAATGKAISCMSAMQNENGGFSSRNTENSESCVQMIVALCELGISLDDPRFVKNGNTMLDSLLTYYDKDCGFKHTTEGNGSDQMATEQGFYGLVAVKRLLCGQSSLYRITDSVKISQPTDSVAVGLMGKNPDVKKMDVIFPGKSFDDISGHDNQSAVEALSSRGIINGKADSFFEPDSTMTRAEFATIIVKGLGLPVKNGEAFSDMTVSDWFVDYVNTAYSYGIVNGVSDTEFNPHGTITREEAAVMVARAAKLCGMDTEYDIYEARDILAAFFDYVKAQSWAVSSLAFCYDEGILPDDNMEIKPKEAVTRAEIAQMVFNMLSRAELL
ncbi:MAG: S-layer homology domain-containing protein [Clostridia bacterium]|nr:S-layer homology domain-containing protein [Clostridia bacterium]